MLEFQYQGRMPKRSNSLQKRNAMLQAALNIILQDGVRGIRHRAVAEQAKVSLSATTYYFSDIKQLIADAFIYFSEINLVHQQKAFANLNNLLINNQQLSNDGAALKELLLTLLIDYLEQQVLDHDSRIIEQAFFQYSLQCPELLLSINQLTGFFERSLEHFLQELKVSEPKPKAQLLLATINHIELCSLQRQHFDKQWVRGLLTELLKVFLD